MARQTLALVLVFSLVFLSLSSVVSADRWKRTVKKYFRESLDSIDLGNAPEGGNDFEIVNFSDLDAEGDGVISRACFDHWMRYAMSVNINAGTSAPVNFCPFGPYGAAIIDAYDRSPSNVHIDGNNCGKLLETNSGIREVNLHNPIMHSEINAIVRLTDCTLHPADCDSTGRYINAQNKTFWQRLYLFTTAASCPADAASETLAGIRKVIQAVTIADLLAWNWTQDSFLEPELIYATSRQSNGVSTLIKGVARNYMKQYFNWQFTNVAHGCPTGCAVSVNPTSGARSCVNA